MCVVLQGALRFEVCFRDVKRVMVQYVGASVPA